MREAFLAGNYQVKMDYGEVTQLSELKFSPFKDRICRVSLVNTGFRGGGGGVQGWLLFRGKLILNIV